MIVRVETYSGYKADEYPLRFEINSVMVDVLEVEDRWYDPRALYFRVFAADAQRYVLRMDNESRAWSVMRGHR